MFYACPAMVYYLPGTTGWSATYGGRHTSLWPAFNRTAIILR